MQQEQKHVKEKLKKAWSIVGKVQVLQRNSLQAWIALSTVFVPISQMHVFSDFMH